MFKVFNRMKSRINHVQINTNVVTKINNNSHTWYIPTLDVHKCLYKYNKPTPINPISNFCVNMFTIHYNVHTLLRIEHTYSNELSFVKKVTPLWKKQVK